MTIRIRAYSFLINEREILRVSDNYIHYTFDPLCIYKLYLYIIASMQKITPCLWFDYKAEEAAKFMPPISKIQRLVTLPTMGKSVQDSWRKRRFSFDYGIRN